MSMKNQFTEPCTCMMCSVCMSVWGCSLRGAVMKKLKVVVYTTVLLAGLTLTGLVLWKCVGVCGGYCSVCGTPKNVQKPVESDEDLARMKRAALPWELSKPRNDGKEEGGVRKTAGMGSGSIGDLHPAQDLGSERIHISAHPLAELSTKKPSTLGPSSQKEGGGGWWGLGLFVAGVVLMVFCCFFCCWCRSRSFYGG